MMTGADRAVAVELKERLLSVAAEHIHRIVVFGSRVRGDSEPDSDLDVAVLVDERTEALVDALSEAAYQVMWDRDFRPLISLLVFDAEPFDRAARDGWSFQCAVLTEGVAL